MRGEVCLRELLGLLTFESGVGVAALLGKRVCECSMGLGVVGVGCDRGLELGDGLGELSALEEEAAAIESEVCTLAVDRDAAEVGGLLSLGGCTGGIALLAEDRGKRDVWTGLIRAQLNGALQCCYGLLRIIVLLVDVAEQCPGVAVIRTQSCRLLEFGLSLREAPELHINNTERVWRVWQLRVKFRSLFELRDGRGNVVFQLEGQAEIVVELWVVGFHGEACAELLDGVVKITLL